MDSYAAFLDRKAQLGGQSGFAPLWLPEFLFDFQAHLVDWSIRKGRSAIFADCGLGKTPMLLVWAENIVRHTNRPVLVLTPLAVAHQMAKEAEKFGVEAHRSHDGKIHSGVNIVNYERLHLFDPADFAGVVCDESSILKSFDGVRRGEITNFMRKTPFRLLDTATAAPNDYIELGTSSEALGELGYTDMLTRFFKNDQNTIKPMSYRHKGENFAALDERAKWRFKGHAEQQFWRWVCSWARAIRRPSDLGFSDDRFVLPELIERAHYVDVEELPDGDLFPVAAVGLKEQREERRRSLAQRCDKAVSLVADTGEPFVVWAQLNDEGDRISRDLKDAVQVSGKDHDEAKEEKFIAFASGQVRGLVTKGRIGAWGLNWQHCNHTVSFPTHSYEQYYQEVRRFWRFGQTRPVTSDLVTTEGDKAVLQNQSRKSSAADRMFSSLVAHMNNAISVDRSRTYANQERLPPWL